MTTWRSRIVETGTADPRSLIANPKNWRKHPKAQADALTGVLGEVGWVQDVIVNRTTGRLVDGHLRVEIAARDNQPTIPVTYVELNEAEEALILATFDPISAMATADRDQLQELLHGVNSGEAALQTLLSELAEKERIIPLPVMDRRPADMTRDHTAMIIVENEPGGGDIRDSKLESYENTGIRQIMLIMNKSQYEYVLSNFRIILEQKSLDTNFDVVLFLLEHYLSSEAGA